MPPIIMSRHLPTSGWPRSTPFHFRIDQSAGLLCWQTSPVAA
jgi:hypothetical protein